MKAGVIAPKRSVGIDGKNSGKCLGGEHRKDRVIEILKQSGSARACDLIISLSDDMGEPGNKDDKRAREKDDKLGELEEFGVDGCKSEGNKDCKEIES